MVDFTKIAARPEGKHAGRGRPYDATMINLAVVLGSIYRLPLRQAVACASMLFNLTGQVVQVPNYSTVCRRRRELNFNFKPHKSNSRVLVIDATGITVRASGRWIEKYGLTGRKSKFIKLHVGIDQQTGRVLAHQITKAAGTGSADAIIGPDLITAAGTIAPIDFVLADRAYDGGPNYKAAREIGARLIVPVKFNAKYGRDPDRNQTIAQIQNVNYKRWKKGVGYGQRAQVESYFSALKRSTSDRVRAKSMEGAVAETMANLWVYDTWLSMV